MQLLFAGYGKGMVINMKNRAKMYGSIKVKYLIFLYIFLGFAIGMFLWATFSYYQNVVPSTIRVKAGTSEQINLNIPASGVISTDADNVLSLRQPVTIVAGENINSCEMELKLFGVVPLKNVDIEVIENTYLTPAGIPIGIYVKTQGVLVVDTGEFMGGNGDTYAPSKYKLQAGDYLIAMDGVGIVDKNQIKNYVENSQGKEIVFQLTRNDEVIQVKIKPEKDENDTYKMGTWLRDNAQGIGTMTYIEENNNFGALGHGINDADTGELLKLGNGLLYNTDIIAIKRGEKGNPGELTGIIEYKSDEVSGVIVDNTSEGIYGVVDSDLLTKVTSDAIPVALKQEVKLGKAQILCTIDGESCYYDIELIKLNPNGENINRQISIKVTDSRLLEKTGGIVQGMSGAPIIQEGKFVGAVTHVLVNDPTKGYGIFIENMLEH